VGAILAFAKAMGEFGATITFVSNIPGETRTVPSAIYAFLQVPGGDAAAWRLVIVSVVIAMGALILSELIARRVTARVGELMLSVELSHRFGDFTLDVAFEAPRGVTVLFGRSGSGKTSVINAVAGLFHPDPADRTPEAVLFDSGRRPFRAAAQAAHGLCVSGGAAVPASPCARTCLWAPVRARPMEALDAEWSSTGSSTCWASGLLDRRPGTCRAARPSVWPSAGRSCRGPRCCWRMSRWPPSMPIERKKSSRISNGCGTIFRFRSSM
jgi:energy-coupling factor transporter ATP-binding protein EcfA2